MVNEWKNNMADYNRRLNEFDAQQDAMHEALVSVHLIEMAEPERIHEYFELAEASTTMPIHSIYDPVNPVRGVYLLERPIPGSTRLTFEEFVQYIHTEGLADPEYMHAPGIGPALVIEGRTPGEMIDSLRSQKIAVSTTMERMIERGMVRATRVTTRAMIVALFSLTETRLLNFVDMGVSFSCISTPRGDRYLVNINSKGLYWHMIQPNGLTMYAYDAFMGFAGDTQHEHVGGKHVALPIAMQAIIAFLVAYSLYKIGKRFISLDIFSAAEKEGEEEDDDTPHLEHQDLNKDARSIAALLANYKLVDGTLVYEKGGGWIYDSLAKEWVRKRDVGTFKLQQLLRANRAHKAPASQYDWESLDPTVRPQRKHISGVDHESDERKDQCDYIVATSEQKLPPGNQLSYDQIIRILHPDVPIVDAVCDQLSNARVAVTNGLSHLFGIAMRENLVLTVAHIQEGNEPLSVIRSSVAYSTRVVYKDPSTDIMILSVTDKRWTPSKDVTKFLATAEDLTLNSSGGLLLPKREGSHVHYGHLVWDLHGLQGTCKRFTNNIARLHWTTVMKPTRPGHCGSPLILNDPSRNSRLFAGMHSFAANTNYAGIAIITRELWEDITSLHESSEQLASTTYHGFPTRS
jgi:hypothetical protein